MATTEDKVVALLDYIRNNGDNEIGMITGTPDYLNSEELNEINQAFRELLVNYLVALGADRIDQMMENHKKYAPENQEYWLEITSTLSKERSRWYVDHLRKYRRKPTEAEEKLGQAIALEAAFKKAFSMKNKHEISEEEWKTVKEQFMSDKWEKLKPYLREKSKLQ